MKRGLPLPSQPPSEQEDVLLDPLLTWQRTLSGLMTLQACPAQHAVYSPFSIHLISSK